MSVKLPSDHAARAQAIDPTVSCLVQAPAGSGKTELLTDRLLALLGTVNRPEEIVAITFTRKAAAEMHARVLAKLRAAQQPCPAESHRRRSWELAVKALERDRERGWGLLDYPARLSIRTIDSFCAHLVRSMPWLSSLGGVPGIADDARPHYQEAARATLELADDMPCVRDFLDHMDVDFAAAQAVLAGMLANRDHWVALMGMADSTEYLRDSLDDAIAEELAIVAACMPPGWVQEIGPALVAAANTLLAGERSSDLCALADWDGETLPEGVEHVPFWRGVSAAVLKADGGVRATVNAMQGFPAKTEHRTVMLAWLGALAPDDPCVAPLRGVRELPVGGYTAAQEATIRTFLQVLRLALAQLQLRFIEQGEVDFAEIALRALEALGTPDEPTDLLLSLDASIRHILVDEFQDTSRLQIGLLERLTAGWQEGDGRTLFLVGDPMQSIYRFRKADVGGFLRVRDGGVGELLLQTLELRDNFRSVGNVVEWVNATCGPIFPVRNHPDLGAIAYTPSQPFNDGHDAAGVHFHPFWRDADDAGTGRTDAQAAMLDQVVELARKALDAHPSSDHPVAVLVRSRSHLGDLVQRLTRAGVPCRAVELVSLRSRQVVSDVLQLARALSHAGDRLAWLSVLRSPLCGLTLESLHQLAGASAGAIPELMQAWLAQHPEGDGNLPPGEARRLRAAANVLLDTGNTGGAQPFARWLQYQWQRLGGPRVYAGAADHADVEQVFRLVERLAPFGGLDPAELEKAIDDLYAAPAATGRSVEIMTIHKSKGLEFETVILPALERLPNRDNAPLLAADLSKGRLLLGPIKARASDAPDPVSAYLAWREKQRAAFEADRLLYVALTRARHTLHLLGILVLTDGDIRQPGAGSLLGRLWPHLPTPTPPAETAARDTAAPVPQPMQGRPLLRRVLADVPDEEHTPFAVPADGQPWQWPADAGPEPIVGTVAHAWLERLGREGLHAWTTQRLEGMGPVFARQLSRAGVAPDALPRAVDDLRDTLLATLASERGRWLLQAAASYREWALLDLDGRVSVIDLAISLDDSWLVVDYKTGRPRPDESADAFAARMRERYGPQLQRYCDHVAALDGRPALGALYFPRADLWVDAVGQFPAGLFKSC